MECSNCHTEIEEPIISKCDNCPNCGTTLIIPSRRDWELMKTNSYLQ